MVVGKVCEMVGLGTSVFTTLSTVDVVTEVALVHDAGGFASSLLTRLLVQAGTQGAVRGGDVYSNDLCSLLLDFDLSYRFLLGLRYFLFFLLQRSQDIDLASHYEISVLTIGITM